MSRSEDRSLADLVVDRPPLDVAADLAVTIDGHELRVESYTDRLFVDLPSVRATVATIRGLPSDRIEPSEVGRLLDAAGLTAVIRINGIEVARLGTDLKGMKYGHLALRPVGLVRALIG